MVLLHEELCLGSPCLDLCDHCPRHGHWSWRHWSLTSSTPAAEMVTVTLLAQPLAPAPAFNSSPHSSAQPASATPWPQSPGLQTRSRSWGGSRREGQLGGKLKVFSMKCGVPRPRPRPGAGQLANGVTVSAGRSANDRRDTVTRQTRPAA